MLIYLPKSLRQRMATTIPSGVSVIVLGLCTALTYGILGVGQQWLSLGISQGIALTLWWQGSNPVALAVGLTIGPMVVQDNLPLALALGMISTGTMLLAGRGLQMLEFSPQGQRLQDGMVFLVAGVGFGAILTAIAGLLLSLWQGDGRLWWTGSLAWLGSATGILLTAPLIFKLRYGRWTWPWLNPINGIKLTEALVCGGLLLTVAGLVFAGDALIPLADRGAIYTQWLEYLPFPIVVWASIRFPAWGGILSTSLLAIWAIAATMQGHGSFNVQSADQTGAMILLQMFFLVLGTTSLLLSGAVRERQRTEEQLRGSWERERLLAEVALRVRQSLHLGTIFQTTVTEVRHLLQTDRVYIALLQGEGELAVVAESCSSDYVPLINPHALPADKPREMMIRAIPGQAMIIHHPDQLPKGDQLRRSFLRYQVKSLLAIPLATVDGDLGLIVAHRCQQPRHWQKAEVRLLEQLATQVAIAIQQAQLYQRVQSLNASLEKQVGERTAQLEDKMLELRDLQQMKALFVQAISHDLRTSVMALLMVLKNLLTTEGEVLTIPRHLLDSLIRSGDRQLTLLNALCEEQTSECRPLHLNPQSLPLQPFLQQICQQWRSACEQHQVTLNLKCDDNLPPLQGDPHYIKQVFDNLLANALNHNPPGIALTLTAQPEGNMVRFILSDNGKGMAKDQCEHLFRLYLRNRHNQRLTGIGLGCYQSRQIVEAHGGHIGVTSSPGQGSHFWFTLPLTV
ncbi:MULTISPECIES: MASE1 domain-containing protein [unclassified Synechocystis]|uniref:MASE1 domain-containing protein n=1 Tax=unclassified Synechocystis TaxID=2640012 RepID=UPI00041A38F8|nr:MULTISPECIES: MASE1 domain-containing protein [unclassified Synechocystis]AIE74384.1 sensory transduction histidine kinase [Synechocystis sp. PCC 6714]MCT0254842.1 MASE1 domain-containing protein [Synechocystis sp. CS-94]